jgi:PsbP-like protein
MMGLPYINLSKLGTMYSRLANCISMNYFTILIVFAASFAIMFTYFLTKEAIAQTQSAYVEQLKILLSDSIQALQKGDNNSALVHLKLADQQMATSTNSSTQTSKTLIEDAIQALQKGDNNSALVHLKLADQQLPGSIRSSGTNSAKQQGMNAATEVTFSTYNNSALGITLQYPSNWSQAEYSYNPGANNTVVSFFSPSKAASALGNASGVSGNFVPYFDLFVFPSRNMSLNEVVDGTVNNFDNNTHVDSSKPIALKGNIPARELVYDTTVARDEHFKKMQVWASSGDTIYVLTYTSQASLYPNYLPIAEKMIQLFELKQHQQQPQKTKQPQKTNNTLAAKPLPEEAKITGNTTVGIPWLH